MIRDCIAASMWLAYSKVVIQIQCNSASKILLGAEFDTRTPSFKLTHRTILSTCLFLVVIPYFQVHWLPSNLVPWLLFTDICFLFKHHSLQISLLPRAATSVFNCIIKLISLFSSFLHQDYRLPLSQIQTSSASLQLPTASGFWPTSLPIFLHITYHSFT